jgi:hypothetical protein
MGRKPIGLARFAALFATLLLTSRGQAQEQPKPSRSNLAEVRFADGSLVRMTLLQDTLDVQTKFGKLTIPFSDIRRVDFGLHVPQDVGTQITQSIKLLGSGLHKDREGASRDLVHAGHFAFPSLQKASRSSDQEVAVRAVSLIRQISERVPPEVLKLKEEDVIQTSEFTVVGRIDAASIKAHSAHFGEQSLKLSELRTLFLRNQNGAGEFVLDAAKHGSALDQWFDTGIAVDATLRLHVTSEGSIDLWPQGAGQYVASPKGYNTAGKGGAFMAGTLIGKIGENGKAFLIGERYDANATEEGRLFLLITPSPWNNASAGAYRVRVQTDHVALSGR